LLKTKRNTQALHTHIYTSLGLHRVRVINIIVSHISILSHWKICRGSSMLKLSSPMITVPFSGIPPEGPVSEALLFPEIHAWLFA
jgi:hypothetical protein